MQQAIEQDVTQEPRAEPSYAQPFPDCALQFRKCGAELDLLP